MRVRTRKNLGQILRQILSWKKWGLNFSFESYGAFNFVYLPQMKCPYDSRFEKNNLWKAEHFIGMVAFFCSSRVCQLLVTHIFPKLGSLGIKEAKEEKNPRGLALRDLLSSRAALAATGSQPPFSAHSTPGSSKPRPLWLLRVPRPPTPPSLSDQFVVGTSQDFPPNLRLYPI